MARNNRELLMLAETFNPSKHRSAGTYISEKLDGMRCIWLPATKGLNTKQIPFANREKKKESNEQIATGLWSRYGNVIFCPEWFTEGFPDKPLDGELWIDRNKFQPLMSTVKTLIPDHEKWKDVRYLVFDAPTYRQIFADGRINNPNYTHQMKLDRMLAALDLEKLVEPQYDFDVTFKLLKRDMKETKHLILHHQELLPFSTSAALEIIEKRLNDITDLGGEGLMIRHPCSMWIPNRSPMLCKLKKLEDAEATIVGHRAGLGKHHGRLGSLQVQFGATIFDLGGFTDDERALFPDAADFARDNPGELLPMDIGHPCSAFPLGAVITFRYRELSDDGVPKEARYHRRKVQE